MTTSSSRSRRPSRQPTQAELAAALTPQDVRKAAQQLGEPRQYPPGLRESSQHDVWIDVGRGRPKGYPPKAIIVLAAARHGFKPGPGFKGASDGVWVSRLRELGFPVLEKGKKPAPGQDCRGADVAASPEQGSTAVGVGSGNAALHPSKLQHDDVLQAIRELDARGNTRRVSDNPHQTAYRIPFHGRWYSMLSVLQIALLRHGVTTLNQLKALLRANAGFTKRSVWRNRLTELGFPPQRGQNAPSTAVHSGPIDASPWPSAEALTRAGILAAARAWSTQTHEFRTAHAAHKWEVWIERQPYPVKGICLIAYRSLGYDATRLASWTKGGRDSAWDRRIEALGFDILPKVDREELERELELERFLERDDVPTEIMREGIVRLTQGRFRRHLIAARGAEVCDVTGIAIPQVLRAGHIRRWADCKDTPAMRTDPDNGLLLAAHLDALFEHGLITFADDGRMLVSPHIDAGQRAHLQISEARRLRFTPTPRQCEYLAQHRRDRYRASRGTEPA